MKQNMGILKGTKGRGANHPRAKLTWSEVKRIRATYAKGSATQKQLAKKYRISVSNIGRIVRNEIWLRDEKGIVE